MKKIISLALILVLVLALFVGCKDQDKPADTKPVDTGSADTKPADSGNADTKPNGSEPALKIALVVAGQFGDRSFYDSSWEGANRLAAEFPVQVTEIECGNENHTAQMKNAADKNDLVICVGWEFYEIADVAPAYPDVKFIWIDNETDEPIPNVLNITYAQNEGSFLAGYIAASMSKTGVIGAVGGEDQPVINDFIVGYKQGAAEFDPNVKVVTNYANSYDDPAKGKECALALADQKADVIFQIASAAGDGVFEAAKERGIYAIGVDSDQKYISPEVIICSMKKEVGNSIYDAVKALLEGDDSKWGSTWVADMSNGYVGIGYGEDSMTQQVPDELKNAVDELAKRVISGEIKVDTTR